jgi:hypothetical protein
MRRQFLWTIVAIVGFSATPTLAQLGKKLSAAEIRAAVAQKTIDYLTISGGTAKVYMARDRVMRGKYRGKKFKGSWTIHNDLLCFDFPGEEDDRCWSLFRVPDGRLQLFTSEGEPAGYIGVADDNPNKF